MFTIHLQFIPREARLINQSGRMPDRSESRANSREKYIYIHIIYLTIIPRARVGYEMIDSQRGA